VKFGHSDVRSISRPSGHHETYQPPLRHEGITLDGAHEHRTTGGEYGRRTRDRFKFTWEFVFKLSVSITVTVAAPTVALKVLSNTDFHRIWRQVSISEPETGTKPPRPAPRPPTPPANAPIPQKAPAAPSPTAPQSWCMGLIDQIEARQRMGSRAMGVEMIRQEFAEHRCDLYGLSAP
jgi:hypothetical protein